MLRAVGIGTAQIAALCPGISRSGVTMATGLLRGLSHEDAARFSFLLSTPVILAAGVLKLGDLAGPLGDGVRPQILVGSVLSFVGAYLSVRFLTRYFENRSLRPFGIYCIAVGTVCLIWFGTGATPGGPITGKQVVPCPWQKEDSAGPMNVAGDTSAARRRLTAATRPQLPARGCPAWRGFSVAVRCSGCGLGGTVVVRSDTVGGVAFERTAKGS